jgi:hypothetical protein
MIRAHHLEAKRLHQSGWREMLHITAIVVPAHAEVITTTGTNTHI